MEQEVLLAALAGTLVLLLLAAVGAAAFLTKGAAVEKPAAPAEQQAPAGRVRGAARAAAGARRRRQQAAAREAAAEEDDEEEEQPAARQAADAPVSRKQAYEERRRRKEEEREAQQAAEEAAAAREAAEAEAARDAEAAQWLGQITMEEEGDAARDEEEEQNLLEDFVEYITERKTVVLEDLAADFDLRVQDVISRVHSLEAMGRITGIMDDRGKFIFVSREEMQAVADFIQQRGRIAIAELAAKSNTFIDLEQKQGGPRQAGGAELLDFDLEAEGGDAAEGAAAQPAAIDFDV